MAGPTERAGLGGTGSPFLSSYVNSSYLNGFYLDGFYLDSCCIDRIYIDVMTGRHMRDDVPPCQQLRRETHMNACAPCLTGQPSVMAVLRRVARPMLASMFIRDGYEAVRHPARLVPVAKPVTDAVAARIAPRVPLLPEDPEQLVRLQGAVRLGAGVLLALGRAPRLASAALAATLVPTALASYRYRTTEDPDERAARRTRLLADVSLLGGLLIAAADTHGKPSLAFRTRDAAGSASDAVAHRAHAVAGRIGDATGTAVSSVTDSVEAARKHLP